MISTHPELRAVTSGGPSGCSMAPHGGRPNSLPEPTGKLPCDFKVILNEGMLWVFDNWELRPTALCKCESWPAFGG